MHGVDLFCCPCHRYVVYLLKTVAQLTSLILLYTYEIITIITESSVNKLVVFILDKNKQTDATKRFKNYVSQFVAKGFEFKSLYYVQ